MRHVPIIVDVFEHRFLSLQGMQKLKEEEDGKKNSSNYVIIYCRNWIGSWGHYEVISVMEF